jgi:hypothetical protein
MPPVSCWTCFRWLFRGRSRRDSGTDRSLTVSGGLATPAPAIYTHREAISRGAPALRPIRGLLGLEHRLGVTPSRMQPEMWVQTLAAVAHGVQARGAWSREPMPPLGGDRSSLLRVQARRTPCYSSWCTVRMVSTDVTKVPIITYTPGLLILAIRWDSTAS